MPEKEKHSRLKSRKNRKGAKSRKKTISLSDCRAIFKRLGTPPNIKRHCYAVSRLAYFLAKRMQEKGIEVDTDAVRKAALLHDALRYVDIRQFRFYLNISPADRRKIAKFRKAYAGLSHEEAMKRFIKSSCNCEKCDKIAEIIRRHCYGCIASKSLRPETWEQKLVNYADKRVSHSKIVSLKERFEEGHRRNNDKGLIFGHSIGYIDSLYFRLEKEIFRIIKISPNSIGRLVLRKTGKRQNNNNQTKSNQTKSNQTKSNQGSDRKKG